MNLPQLSSLIVLIFALLYLACATEELGPIRTFVLSLFTETNQQGKRGVFNRSEESFIDCYSLSPFPFKSLSLSGSEKCMLLYPDRFCDRHVFRVFPGAAINNDLTSLNFSPFSSLGHCKFPNNSGLLFYKQSDSPAFYSTSEIETYTGCQNLPDNVTNEKVEGVQLIGACANLFRGENCTGEVFYLRPINAGGQWSNIYFFSQPSARVLEFYGMKDFCVSIGRSPPAIAQGRWYDYFPLQSRVASFSPCGANWATTETGTAVTGITDEPETDEPETSLQPSLHSSTPNIFAPICILLYLLTM